MSSQCDMRESGGLCLPVDAEMRRIARRVIWFEPPEQALSRPARFLCYLMTHGRPEDVLPVMERVGREAFRAALRQALPGIMDARSWHYWHVVLDMEPTPPLPRRACC